jgi:hypothetical protein
MVNICMVYAFLSVSGVTESTLGCDNLLKDPKNSEAVIFKGTVFFFLTEKGIQIKISKGKVHVMESKGNQARTTSCPFLVKLC